MKEDWNKYNLLTRFFLDQQDYISFLVGLKLRAIYNDPATCFAELTKKDGVFLYTLTWNADGKFIGDYVVPFRATLKNIDIFNAGCKILAQRLTIYLDTGDMHLVPDLPPAFGILTHHPGQSS